MRFLNAEEVWRAAEELPQQFRTLAEGLDRTFRAALRVIDGGLSDGPRDTARTHKTRAGHEIGVSGGH